MFGLRIVRRLLIVAAVLGALFAGANAVAERFAEQKVAELAQDRFGLSERPSVDIRGFPVLVNVLQGSLPAVAIESSDLAVDELRVRLLRVRLESVRAEGLTGKGPLRVSVGSGDATAEVDEAAVNELVRRRGEKARVSLRDGSAVVRARRRIGLRERQIVATGTLTLRSSTLVFRPTRVTVDGEPVSGFAEREAKRQSTVSVRLPELPGGIEMQGVSVHQGFVRLTAVLDRGALDLGR